MAKPPWCKSGKWDVGFSFLGLKLVVFGQVDLSMENLAKKANRMLALHMEQTHWRCLFRCESTPFLNESLFCTSYFLCKDPVWTYFFPKDCLHFMNVFCEPSASGRKKNLCLCSSMYIGMESLRENKMGCWDDWSCNQIKVPAVLQSLPWGRCDWSNVTVFLFEFPPLTGKDFLLLLWLRASKKSPVLWYSFPFRTFCGATSASLCAVSSCCPINFLWLFYQHCGILQMLSEMSLACPQCFKRNQTNGYFHLTSF